MRGRWGGAEKGALLLAVLAPGLLAFPMKADAVDKFSGRVYVTYQNAENGGVRKEYLAERFEATLRDRVFERNDLAITVYLDNAKDLTADQTVRRYRGMLNLQNPYYTFNARYSPRQEVTPLEQSFSTEIVDKQLLLDIHVPDLPRLRLSYGETERFSSGLSTRQTTDLRGDINYAYKIFSMGLNRYHSTSENSSERTTTQTGADLRAGKAFGPEFTFDVGYQYQLNETRRTPGLPEDFTNHTASGLFTSRYRRLVLGTLTLNRRWLESENGSTWTSTEDNDLLSALFFPTSPVTLELSRTYIQVEQDTSLVRSDYGTAQMLANGHVWHHVQGLLQLTRRHDIDSFRGVVPDHIYYVRVQSFDRRGLDLRAEAGVSERVKDTSRTDRFTNSSLLDIYLRPWNNLTLVPRVQYIRYSDNIAFTGNDRASYALNGTYIARPITLGVNLSRNLVTTGAQSVSNAATFNISANLRQRSSVTVSYGINELDQFASGGVPEVYSKSKTLNVWAQVWVLPRGSLSANYTNVEREQQKDSSYLAVSYRQEF